MWQNSARFVYLVSVGSRTHESGGFSMGIRPSNFDVLDILLYLPVEQFSFSSLMLCYSFPFTGMQQHVMSFEVGGVLEDSHWQAPSHCFTDNAAAALAARPRCDPPLPRLSFYHFFPYMYFFHVYILVSV